MYFFFQQGKKEWRELTWSSVIDSHVDLESDRENTWNPQYTNYTPLFLTRKKVNEVKLKFEGGSY